MFKYSSSLNNNESNYQKNKTKIMINIDFKDLKCARCGFQGESKPFTHGTIRRVSKKWKGYTLIQKYRKDIGSVPFCTKCFRIFSQTRKKQRLLNKLFSISILIIIAYVIIICLIIFIPPTGEFTTDYAIPIIILVFISIAIKGISGAMETSKSSPKRFIEFDYDVSRTAVWIKPLNSVRKYTLDEWYKKSAEEIEV